MQKLIYRNPNGEEIDFTSGDFGVTKWSGFSKVDMDVQSQQVPFHDGSVFLDALLGERELSVTVAVNDDNNLEKRYRLKREMIHCLNPKLGEGELIYTNDYTSKKIVCVPDIPEFDNKNMNDSGTMKAMCSFTASNPYWEDVEGKYVLMNKGNSFIKNEGDLPCSVKINISTPNASNISIKNLTNKNLLKINGSIEGSAILSTEFGKKSFIKQNRNILSKESIDFVSVCFSSEHNLFAGVSDLSHLSSSKFIAISEDGINWNINYIPGFIFGGKILYSNFYHKFIAGSQGGINVSDDLITWQFIAFDPIPNLYSTIPVLAKDNKIFVAQDERLFFSNDLDTWEVTPANSQAICIKNNMFVSYSHNYIYTSTDGVTWETQQHNELPELVNDMEYNESCDLFCLVADDGIIYTSEDLETWSLQTSGTNESLFDVLSVFGKFIICGYNGIILTSEDGVTWGKDTVTDVSLNCLLYVQQMNLILVYGADNCVGCSADGIVWDIMEKRQRENFLCVKWDEENERFIIITYNVYTSEDGVTWEKIIPTSGIYVQKFDFNKKIYIGVGGFQIYRSENLKDWVRIEKSNRMSDVKFCKIINKFIICGNNGTILTSTDGMAWESQTSGTNLNLQTICESDNLIVICGDNGIILTSEDGVNWEPQTSGTSNNIMYSHYFNDIKKFFASADDEILSSEDGVNWEIKNRVGVSSNEPINFIRNESEGVFYGIVSNVITGAVYFSFDSINWISIIPSFRFQDIIYSLKLNRVVLCGSRQGTGVIVYDNDENLIEKISEDSNMNFKLDIGDNQLLLLCDGELYTRLSYTQKYLGV